MGLYPALFIQQSSSPVTMVISLPSFVSRLRGGRCAGGDQGQLSWGWRTAGRGALPAFLSPSFSVLFSPHRLFLPLLLSFQQPRHAPSQPFQLCTLALLGLYLKWSG